MKLSFSFLVLLSTGLLTAPYLAKASPIQGDTIPSGVDWFVHLDGDLFRETRSGSALIREFREVLPIDEETKKQMPIDPVLIFNGIRGLTVFGEMPDMDSGNPEEVEAVVVMEATPDLIQVFRGMISGMQLEQPEAVASADYLGREILTLNGEGVHGTFVDDSRLAIGKSLTALHEFLDVCSGKKEHISFEQRFRTYQMGLDSGVFFGAFVEGLGDFKDLPAEARILKLTQAVSVQLGEKGDSVNLLASLVTDSDKTGKQVSEVLQGILALFVITQNGQPDVAALVESARVVQQGPAVTLGLSYPVVRVEAWAEVLAEMAREAIEDSQAEEESGADGESGDGDSDATEEADAPAGASA